MFRNAFATLTTNLAALLKKLTIRSQARSTPFFSRAQNDSFGLGSATGVGDSGTAGSARKRTEKGQKIPRPMDFMIFQILTAPLYGQMAKCVEYFAALQLVGSIYLI